MYSQTRLISHWRDCLYCVMLNGVDIKKSCFTEVNINIQPFALLKQFYTLYYRKHKRPHAAA